MRVKESISLLFNDISWDVFPLAEHVILLECSPSTPIEQIHQSTHLILELLTKQMDDIVSAYHSITLFTELSLKTIVEKLMNRRGKRLAPSHESEVIQLPICYEQGQDFARVSEMTGLKKEEIIDRHLKDTYRAVFMGFTPGFIYADGLNKSLACPRLDSPRKVVLEGSIGIGGKQTGIYSLSSPGGWNIIGRTPVKIFDKKKQPPMKWDEGVCYTFYRITKEAFEEWGN